MTAPAVTRRRAAAQAQPTLPAICATPTLDRWRDRLAADRGALEGGHGIARNTPVVPAAACAQILEELDAALRPAGAETAVRWAWELIGSYPNAKPPNPDVYVAAIAEALADCPADLGQAVVKRVVKASRFLPAPAEVAAAVERVRGERLGLRALAAAHLREARRRRSEAERQRLLDAERADMDSDRERKEAFFAIDARDRLALADLARGVDSWSRFKALWPDGGAEAWEARRRLLAVGRARGVASARLIVLGGYVFRRWLRRARGRG